MIPASGAAYQHHPVDLPLDIVCITSYAFQLSWAMNWPQFMVTNLQNHDNWLWWFDNRSLLQLLQKLWLPLQLTLAYSDATAASKACLDTTTGVSFATF
jgi:hypothetical protein